LLAEYDGFGEASDLGVDLGVGDVAFPQATVGPMVIGAGGDRQFLEGGSHIGVLWG